MTQPVAERPVARQPITKRLCMTVLIMEAVVIFLSVPVAIQIDHQAPRSALTAGIIAVAAAVIFAGLTRRVLAAALLGGSLLQIFVIVSGTTVPVMYFLGAVFAALWVIGIFLGRHIDGAASPAPGSSGSR